MSEKLKMRVSRLADDGLDAERVQETLVYHWDRILWAVGVLLLLIALLLWGGIHFLTHDVVQPKPSALTRTTPAQALPEAPAPASLSAVAPESLVPLQASQTVKPEEKPVSTVHMTNGTNETVSPVKPAPEPKSAQVPKPAQVAKPAQAPKPAQVPKAAPAPKSASSSDKSAAGHELPPVRLSHHVSQFQLTRGLDQKQPTDNLGGQVNLNGRSLVKVYLYSRLEGLKGQRVYHEWFHGQKRVARIEIRPYLQTMNASSSKYLTPAMTGRWTVKVVDHKGHMLAERHFRVVDR